MDSDTSRDSCNSAESSSSEDEDIIIDDDLVPELTLTVFRKSLYHQALQARAKKQFLKILKNYDWDDLDEIE